MRKTVMGHTEQLSMSELQTYLMDLAHCEDESDVFQLLASLLQDKLEFEDCIVLNRYKDRYYETIAATNAVFHAESWPECQLFSEALEKGCVLSKCPLQELEFALLNCIDKVSLKNSLVISIDSVGGQGLFIFTNVGISNCHNILNTATMKILLQQVYFTFINQVKLQKQTLKSLSMINKFTTLSTLFKELGTEWFWRSDTSMLFKSVNNIETVGNIYTEKFVGNSIESLITKSEQLNVDKWRDFNQIIENQEDFYNFEFEVTSVQDFWVSFSGKPQFDEQGYFAGYLGLAKNITVSKEREAALQTEKLKAEDASKTKSKFLSVMSHEIRTPIHAVMGMIELLLDTKLTPEQQQLVNYANSSTEILYGLITDVLDFSKIESGTVSFISKPFNIKLLSENIVGQLNIIEKSDDILFTTNIDENIPKYVVGDEYRLGQILFNVIGNAFKFTKHGQITLNVNLFNEQLIFDVKDSGIGIAKKNLELIFQPFSQVNDSINRKSEGVGLGLSISKNLLELMGGEITLETQLGLGSKFTISIPFKEAKDSENTHSVIQKQASLSILVAEDNKTNQVLIKAYLEKLNHKVTLANEGREAIELFKRKKFDLVLMDIMMPIMDGLSAAEYIRDELISDIPIYALTANAEKDNKASCFKVGMNKVLTKPIKFQALQEALSGVYPRG